MNLILQFEIAFQVLQNAALLVLGAMIYCQIRQWLQDRLPERAEQVLFGIVFGVLGVVSMMAKIELVPGVHVDLRIATVVVGTLFGGFEAGLVTLVIVELFGAVVGGAGVEVRLINALLGFGLGAAVMVRRRRNRTAVGWRDLVGLGLAVSVTGLCLWSLWPQPVVATPLLRSVGPLWFALVTLAVSSLGGTVLLFERGRMLSRALRERDADLRAIMDNAPLSIFLKDREGRFRLFNRRFAEWAGKRPEEISGKTTRDFCPPAIAEQSEATDREVLERGKITSYEWSADPFERGVEHIRTIKFPVRDTNGVIVGVAGVSLDISASRRADLELRDVQHRLQAIMDNAPLAIFLKDREGRFQLINRGYTD